MLIESLSNLWRKSHATNSTSSSFSAKSPTATEPTGDGVVDMRRAGGSSTPNGLRLQPYGVGSDNDTFSMRVWGWAYLGDSSTGLWVPTLLAEVACTLCTVTGVSGKDISNTERLVDTMTVTYGNDGVSLEVLSPANNLPGHLVVDVKGCQKAEIVFDMTGATSGNCLHAKI